MWLEKEETLLAHAPHHCTVQKAHTKNLWTVGTAPQEGVLFSLLSLWTKVLSFLFDAGDKTQVLVDAHQSTYQWAISPVPWASESFLKMCICMCRACVCVFTSVHTQTTTLAQVSSSGMSSASFDTGFLIGLSSVIKLFQLAREPQESSCLTFPVLSSSCLIFYVDAVDLTQILMSWSKHFANQANPSKPNHNFYITGILIPDYLSVYIPIYPFIHPTTHQLSL